MPEHRPRLRGENDGVLLGFGVRAVHRWLPPAVATSLWLVPVGPTRPEGLAVVVVCK